MNKFDLVQKVFEKLNIDYPSPKVLQSLKILNLSHEEFINDIIESVGSEDNERLFFIYYLKLLEKTTPQGFFVDISKYYGPGSFVVVKFDKVIISEWSWSQVKIVDVDIYDTDSRIVLPEGTFTLDNIIDIVDDLGSMGIVDEIKDSISGVIQSELQRNLGVPFNSEWSK